MNLEKIKSTVEEKLSNKKEIIAAYLYGSILIRENTLREPLSPVHTTDDTQVIPEHLHLGDYHFGLGVSSIFSPITTNEVYHGLKFKKVIMVDFIF